MPNSHPMLSRPFCTSPRQSTDDGSHTARPQKRNGSTNGECRRNQFESYDFNICLSIYIYTIYWYHIYIYIHISCVYHIYHKMISFRSAKGDWKQEETDTKRKRKWEIAQETKTFMISICLVSRVESLFLHSGSWYAWNRVNIGTIRCAHSGFDSGRPGKFDWHLAATAGCWLWKLVKHIEKMLKK